MSGYYALSSQLRPHKLQRSESRLKVFVYDLPPKWNSDLLRLNYKYCRGSVYSVEANPKLTHAHTLQKKQRAEDSGMLYGWSLGG